MNRIQQLPASVITKIAAGEVIERPASVVKELLENSIDAGSTRIDLEIDNGGLDRIAVIDNGCGIQPEDLPLAFASHATSKLRDADDLFRVGTLGFRGEALASIGGVGQVTLQSRPAALPCGAEIQCQGGELSAIKPWNGAPGTRFEVRHLFFNTPVRRKFLRTTSTEFGHISEALTRLALAYPSLHFTLKHNGKIVYDLPATSDLSERIGLFFGNDVRQALYEVRAERGSARLAGYIADPACDRGNAKLQYLFLNGRWIRDRSIGHAVQEGYRGLLMTGRYAVSFLFLEMPPDLVDVNVHPTKAEVRFRDAQSLFHLVLTTIRSRLTEANLMPKLQAPLPISDFGFRISDSQAAVNETNRFEGAKHQSSSATGTLEFTERAPVRYDPEVFAIQPEIQDPASEAEDVGALEPEIRIPKSEIRATKVFQLHDSYIVLETPDGMLVIDQHALHERILFEQLKNRWRGGQMEKQQLLIPEPVDLTAEQATRLLEARKELAEMGLDVEDFGNGTVLLSSYPAVLGKRPPVAILREVVDFLTAQDRTPNHEQLLHGLMSMMACKAAVKAGDRLNSEQIAALLEQRHLANDNHHCPHGRPTSLLFSRRDLDKQ
ncbi:MAG TPA: DNA mismatch repair endonuclease MutL, partial [Gemmataceae bacterium]|nr:DNA mismatch repair endonuclease MutL [Gemmataceae bacterium]